MVIGVISDTYDSLDAIRLAVKLCSLTLERPADILTGLIGFLRGISASALYLPNTKTLI